MVSRPFVAIAAIAVVLLATPCCLGQMAEPRFIAFDQKFFRRMDPGVKQVIGFTAFAFDFASFDDVRAHDVRTHRARCSQAAGETGRGEGCVTVRVLGQFNKLAGRPLAIVAPPRGSVIFILAQSSYPARRLTPCFPFWLPFHTNGQFRIVFAPEGGSIPDDKMEMTFECFEGGPAELDMADPYFDYVSSSDLCVAAIVIESEDFDLGVTYGDKINGWVSVGPLRNEINSLAVQSYQDFRVGCAHSHEHTHTQSANARHPGTLSPSNYSARTTPPMSRWKLSLSL